MGKPFWRCNHSTQILECAGVEAGKSKEAEKPADAEEGKKVVEPGIGEAEPVTETE